MYSFYTVTAQQISILRGVSYNTARKEWQQVRDALELPKNRPLFLRDLAAYLCICPNELAQKLYGLKIR